MRKGGGGGGRRKKRREGGGGEEGGGGRGMGEGEGGGGGGEGGGRSYPCCLQYHIAVLTFFWLSFGNATGRCIRGNSWYLMNVSNKRGH